MIKIKRIYDQSSPQDGMRILVDRIWPRGLSREDAGLDLWLKHLAPSNELRKWFSHDEDKWDDFKEKYSKELEAKRDQVEQLLKLEKDRGTITLLFAAKDQQHNNASALKSYLKNLR
ncbi:MAG: DUF488 domain-containing protein [Actinomycetota bacterium]|jgi:uncharacterized protein YeaO (DUF488 family)|nr:DUF488 domain-containing protein [Actinomycetota bacterium]